MKDSVPVYHRSGGSDLWGTPIELYRTLDTFFGFTVDVAAIPSNTKADRYWSPEEDALGLSWAGEIAFCNPPYSDISKWVAKASAEGDSATVVALIPARTDTRYFWEHCRGAHIRLLPSRLRFETLEREPYPFSAPFPSCIVVWSPELDIDPTLPSGVFFWDYRVNAWEEGYEL